MVKTIDIETGEEIPLAIPVALESLEDDSGKILEGRTFKVQNLAPIVQAIVNRDNWQHNNSLVLLLERYFSPDDPPQTRAFYSFDGNGEVPLLRVYWSLEGVIERTYISGWNTDPEAELEDKLLENHHQMIDNTGNVLKQIRLGKILERGKFQKKLKHRWDYSFQK
ncbi:hypothetical protein BGP_0880 [Beggiatoa sp. PS]|nr:hypothetical protein BGP_0880 [Beggiatoa sp. PS]